MMHVGRLNTTELNSDYMNNVQLEYFKTVLLNWREELVSNSRLYMAELTELNDRSPDPIDYGTVQVKKERILSQMRRNELTLGQIGLALQRIEKGEYGYCEVTGAEIGLERLKIVPLATLCMEAQQEIERRVTGSRRY